MSILFELNVGNTLFIGGTDKNLSIWLTADSWPFLYLTFSQYSLMSPVYILLYIIFVLQF